MQVRTSLVDRHGVGSEEHRSAEGVQAMAVAVRLALGGRQTSVREDFEAGVARDLWRGGRVCGHC